jgi:hypothetical protein
MPTKGRSTQWVLSGQNWPPMPLQQTGKPGGADTAQPEQLVRSVRMLQIPPHWVNPESQAQLPETQLALDAHTLPQPPQLSGSELNATQPAPHTFSPGSQVGVPQLPPVQLAFPAQAFPQAPQFRGSVFKSTQASEHEVLPAAQAAGCGGSSPSCLRQSSRHAAFAAWHSRTQPSRAGPGGAKQISPHSGIQSSRQLESALASALTINVMATAIHADAKP